MYPLRLAFEDSAGQVAKPLFNLDDPHLRGHDHNCKEGDKQINAAFRTHLLSPFGVHNGHQPAGAARHSKTQKNPGQMEPRTP
jgi:hypothetical protein